MIELPDTSTDKGQYEASAILARLMGWKVEPDIYYLDTMLFTELDGTERIGVNLYHPGDMSLAWRVLNWIMTYPMDTEEAYQFRAKFQLRTNFGELLSLSADKAVRFWLDKILELANEAGMLDRLQQ